MHTENAMSRLSSVKNIHIGAIPASRATAVLVAGLLGAFILFGVGFAQVTHGAAHDSRHSVSFPCH